MKKLTIVVLVVLFPTLLFSQKINYGFSVGMSTAKWRGDADLFAYDLANEMNKIDGISGFSFTNKSRLGIAIGAFAEVPLTKSFFFQPELAYSQKGTKFSGNGYVYSYKVEEKIIMQTDYINLSTLAKFYLSDGKTKPYLIAGPGVGYLVRSKMKVVATVAGESESDSEKMEGLKKFDANIIMGAGFIISSLKLDIRYQLGLAQVFDNENGSGYEMKNGGFTFNLVYMLNTKNGK